MFIVILISLCLLALFICLTIFAHDAYVSLKKLEKQLAKMTSQTECNKIELSEKQKVVESLVDKSTSAVEDIHQAISNITFDILESIPVTKHTSKIVKDIHYTTSKSVYNIVRLVNKQIGELSSVLLKSN